MNSTELLATLTLYLSLGITLIALLAWVFFRRHKLIGHIIGILTVIGSITLFVLSVFMMYSAPFSEPVAFPVFLGVGSLHFYLDALSVFFILLVNTIALAAVVNIHAFLNGTTPKTPLQEPSTFHLLVNLFHLTMLLVPMIDNLIGVWVAIELTTFGSAFLVAYRGDPRSWEATWKYLMITSIGIIVALLGTMFLANAIPPEIIEIERDKVMDWTFLVRNASQLNQSFVWLAFLFALVGYGTKAGLAPMHTWLPDGHGEAPSPISALLSGVLLKSALYAILRFYTLTNTVLGDHIHTSWVLLCAGVLSLLVATPLILKENPFKRVLAYHSLEHMGIITFAIGLGGPITMFGALLHMLNHAVTKALMFLAYGNVMKQYEKHGIAQDNITGILRSMPLTGGILALGGLALVGTPPFNIFMSEFIILWSALDRLKDNGLVDTNVIPSFNPSVVILAVSIFIVSTTVIFYGLIKHLAKLMLNKMQGDIHVEKIGLGETAPLIFLFIFMFMLGVWIFPPLARLINASVAIIINIK
jgi:hydrogenase-4 component F